MITEVLVSNNTNIISVDKTLTERKLHSNAQLGTDKGKSKATSSKVPEGGNSLLKENIDTSNQEKESPKLVEQESSKLTDKKLSKISEDIPAKSSEKMEEKTFITIDEISDDEDFDDNDVSGDKIVRNVSPFNLVSYLYFLVLIS